MDACNQSENDDQFGKKAAQARSRDRDAIPKLLFRWSGAPRSK